MTQLKIAVNGHKLESLLTEEKARIRPSNNLKLAHIQDRAFNAEIITKLIRENDTKVYGTSIVPYQEPEFYFEPLDRTISFVKRARDNRLVGITSGTQTKKTTPEIEKHYFMRKLGMISVKFVRSDDLCVDHWSDNLVLLNKLRLERGMLIDR